MRQAGRYLPEFREIREKNPNFIKLCLNYNLSSEITLQPLKRFELDAAIIFSDILMLPYGLNQQIEFKKNFGPLLGEFKLNEMITFEFVKFAAFTFEVIALTQNESIHLKVVESKFDNLGHIMKYDLDENDGKTRVRYTHEGFVEMDDFYANMNYSSAKYLESLRQYCQTGKGEAFGSSSYRA